MFLVCITCFSTKCFCSSVELRLERFHAENRLSPQLSRGGLLLGTPAGLAGQPDGVSWGQTHREGGGQPAQALQGSTSGEGAECLGCVGKQSSSRCDLLVGFWFETN